MVLPMEMPNLFDRLPRIQVFAKNDYSLISIKKIDNAWKVIAKVMIPNISFQEIPIIYEFNRTETSSTGASYEPVISWLEDVNSSAIPVLRIH